MKSMKTDSRSQIEENQCDIHHLPHKFVCKECVCLLCTECANDIPHFVHEKMGKYEYLEEIEQSLID